MYRTICDCLQSFHRHKNREPSGISLFLAMIPTARLIRRIHPVAFCSVQIRLFFHPPSHVSSAMPSINQITISTCFVQPANVLLWIWTWSRAQHQKERNLFFFLSFLLHVFAFHPRAHTPVVWGAFPHNTHSCTHQQHRKNKKKPQTSSFS